METVSKEKVPERKGEREEMMELTEAAGQYEISKSFEDQLWNSICEKSGDRGNVDQTNSSFQSLCKCNTISLQIVSETQQ